MSWLKESFDVILETYTYQFLIKHEVIESMDDMSRVEIHDNGIILIDKYIFEVFDIIYDIENDIEKGLIIRHHDDNYDRMVRKEKPIRFKDFLKTYKYK